MKRTFIYADDKSNKFWTIEVKGNSYTVEYGKIGTDGQTQTKEFADESTCQIAVGKVISEKTKKGYTEQTGGLSAAPVTTPKDVKSIEKSAVASVAGQKEVEISGEAKPKATGNRDHRQFVYRDGLVHKFWNIDRKGLEVIISFGAWGKKSRTNSKSYESEERAAKEMIKLTRPKYALHLLDKNKTFSTTQQG